MPKGIYEREKAKTNPKTSPAPPPEPNLPPLNNGRLYSVSFETLRMSLGGLTLLHDKIAGGISELVTVMNGAGTPGPEPSTSIQKVLQAPTKHKHTPKQKELSEETHKKQNQAMKKRWWDARKHGFNTLGEYSVWLQNQGETKTT